MTSKLPPIQEEPTPIQFDEQDVKLVRASAVMHRILYKYGVEDRWENRKQSNGTVLYNTFAIVERDLFAKHLEAHKLTDLKWYKLIKRGLHKDQIFTASNISALISELQDQGNFRTIVSWFELWQSNYENSFFCKPQNPDIDRLCAVIVKTSGYEERLMNGEVKDNLSPPTDDKLVPHEEADKLIPKKNETTMNDFYTQLSPVQASTKLS